jgi:hypothetical protein
VLATPPLIVNPFSLDASVSFASNVTAEYSAFVASSVVIVGPSTAITSISFPLNRMPAG